MTNSTSETHCRQRQYRPCPTCNGPIFEKYATYCSDECIPQCNFDRCPNPVRGKGKLCNTHRAQLRTTGTLKPSRVARRSRRCRYCGKRGTTKNRRQYCSEACYRLAKRNRPRYFECACCETVISLMPVVRNGRRQRSDSAVCDECRREISATRAALTPRQLAARDGTTCGICNFKVDMTARDDLKPSVDHIIARAHGGADDPSNLQLAHLWCNQIKNARTGTSGFGPRRLKQIANRLNIAS